MKQIFNIAALCVILNFTIQARAEESFLVKEGHPRSEIVIADKSPRTTQLAAQELQTYVEKISGAKLSITTTPNPQVPVKIYVGRSSHTDKLKINSENLKFGAYRIVSGDHWLVLIGDDTNFTPTEPWPRNYTDIRSGKMQRAWNEITGKHWGYPHSQLHKHYSGPTSLFGTPKEQHVDKEGRVNVWTYDERGSFNAVCGFLRDLGVRWYLPGELGEVVPSIDTISLPQIDKTVRPDFPMRILNFRAGVYGRDVMMWGFRLGVRQPFGRQAAHGLSNMTHNEHTLTDHPKWFALYGGRRHTQIGQRLNQLCYSSEELFQEAVRFAQTQFDHYDMDVVSIMPPDGYTAICQCELCEGKGTPERGNRGSLSDYVWEFVNRVAKEVKNTHPGKMISNCAYGIYTLPPQNIDKLESNVQVIIVGGRRPTGADREQFRQLREDWTKKTDNPIVIFENYPFTGRGFYLPAYIPRVMGESINATKGVSRGEDIWLTMDFSEKAIGYNHFLAYFTARMYWGGKGQDAGKMFDEYCQLFYGSAAQEMREFFGYCENHWREMEKDAAKALRALELFAAAQAAAKNSTNNSATAGKDSVYVRRIALIDNYLNGLRNKSVQLSQKRGPVPRLRLVGSSRGEIVIDGKLDDEPWQKCPTASTGRMRELQTGRQPIFGTSIKTAWIGNNLYFAIRCQDQPGEKLNIATTKNSDQAIWYGDVVEILLDTESHSYYQIAVNPAGAIINLDRGAPRNGWFRWDSKAEVATHVADDHWTVEIRIPVVQDKNDPLHQVIGRKPTQSLPWHINVCRQRIRENGSEHSAFAPTGKSGFHFPMKFAHFYAGLSHQFAADATVTDYLIESRAAFDLMRKRKLDEALSALVALAGGDDVNEYQKSAALEQAALCARNLRDYDRAAQFADQIPITAVADTVRMQNLLAQRKWKELIEQFGSEDLTQWPFWKAGEAYFSRGRAHASAASGDKAEADLQAAMKLTSNRAIRLSILLSLGGNRETNLKDDDAALQAYQQITAQKGSNGSASYFRGVQSAAKIQTRQGQFDNALGTLKLVDADKLRGFWRGSMLLARGKTLSTAGRKDEALATYQSLSTDNKAIPQHQKTAQQAIKAMTE